MRRLDTNNAEQTLGDRRPRNISLASESRQYRRRKLSALRAGHMPLKTHAALRKPLAQQHQQRWTKCVDVTYLSHCRS
jgi:hypothetical protein